MRKRHQTMMGKTRQQSVPAYLLDREGYSRAKALLNTNEQKQ